MPCTSCAPRAGTASESGLGSRRSSPDLPRRPGAWLHRGGETCELAGVGPVPVSTVQQMMDGCVPGGGGHRRRGRVQRGPPGPAGQRPPAHRPGGPGLPVRKCPAARRGTAWRSTTPRTGPSPCGPSSTNWPGSVPTTTASRPRGHRLGPRRQPPVARRPRHPPRRQPTRPTTRSVGQRCWPTAAGPTPAARGHSSMARGAAGLRPRRGGRVAGRARLRAAAGAGRRRRTEGHRRQAARSWRPRPPRDRPARRPSRRRRSSAARVPPVDLHYREGRPEGLWSTRDQVCGWPLACGSSLG